MSDELRHDGPEPARPNALSDHTLPVEEASQHFVNAGIPRSLRTVQRYCQVGYLSCISVQGELGSRYLVSATSVENRIKELQQVQQIMGARASAPRRAMTRNDAPSRATARNGATDDAADEIEPGEKKRLQDQIQILEIDKRVRDELISRLDSDRKDLLTTVADQGRQIGKLEAQMALLEAPKGDNSREREAPPAL